MGALNLFPNRAAIGQVDARGDVYMTPEFSRALSDLLARVGGTNGESTDDLAAGVAVPVSAAGLGLPGRVEQLGHELAAASQLVAQLAELRKQVADAQHELAAASQLMAQLAELRKKTEALELENVTVPPGVDWEHPGKLGARTANSAMVTTLNRITFAPPATAATVSLGDNASIGMGAAAAFAVTAGKTLAILNTLTLSGTDAATVNFGAGGTLGEAAYAAAGTYATRSTTALAPVATDAATTMTLANSIRARIIAAGIGT